MTAERVPGGGDEPTGVGLPAVPADDAATSVDDDAPRTRNVPLAVYLVAVIVGAVVAVVLSARGEQVTRSQVDACVALVVTASVYDVVARRIERIRRRTSVGPYVTMNSVWTFCGAVILPTWLISVLVPFLFVQEELQARLADNPKPLYRVAFNVAAVVLPCLAVHHLTTWTRRLGAPDAQTGVALPLALVAAIVVYAACNTALVAGVLVLAQRSIASARSALGTGGENLLETATLTLGGLLALAIWRSVWLVVLVVPILVLLQRIALVDHLESAASSDSKTGLLNASAWSHLAERELLRASARETPATVMIIDLDHFKRVNDVYGHLSGDAVLRAVAGCMTGVLRERDLLSRFGGEEFVALLPDADVAEAERVAERLRQRIAGVVVEHRGDLAETVTRVGGEDFGAAGSPETIRVTVSIGLAAFPRHGTELTGLVAKADAALYEAKGAGRNQVHTSI